MDTSATTSAETRQEFLENALGNGFGCYFWWLGERYADGYDWDIHPEDDDEPFFTVKVAHPETEWDIYGNITSGSIVVKTLSVRDITEAYRRLSESHDLGDGSLDCDTGDALFQIALLGEVHFA